MAKKFLSGQGAGTGLLGSLTGTGGGGTTNSGGDKETTSGAGGILSSLTGGGSGGIPDVIKNLLPSNPLDELTKNFKLEELFNLTDILGVDPIGPLPVSAIKTNNILSADELFGGANSDEDDKSILVTSFSADAFNDAKTECTQRLTDAQKSLKKALKNRHNGAFAPIIRVRLSLLSSNLS